MSWLNKLTGTATVKVYINDKHVHDVIISRKMAEEFVHGSFTYSDMSEFVADQSKKTRDFSSSMRTSDKLVDGKGRIRTDEFTTKFYREANNIPF